MIFIFCSLTFWWSTSEGISQPGDWHQQFLNFKPGTSAVILLDNGYHLPPSRGTHEEKDGSYAPTKGEKCKYTPKINSWLYSPCSSGLRSRDWEGYKDNKLSVFVIFWVATTPMTTTWWSRHHAIAGRVTRAETTSRRREEETRASTTCESLSFSLPRGQPCLFIVWSVSF